MERMNVRLLSIWGRSLNRLKILAPVIVDAETIYSLNRFKLKEQINGTGNSCYDFAGCPGGS